jgi:DNA polymerase-3 subunit epsilon
MNLLILDTETTGLDPSQHKVIEVGAILYSVDYQTVLHQFATLLHAKENPQERINCIPAAALHHLDEYLVGLSLMMLKRMAAQADCVVAHNVAFDRQWFDGDRLPVLVGCDEQPLTWLCTMTDFVFPNQTKPNESLVSLALAHGIGVSSAHRALTDCQLIAALFDRMDDLLGMIAYAARPKALYVAHVSYDDRQLAKDAGFSWNQLVPKAWARRMTAEDAAMLPFRVIEVVAS